MYDEFVAKLTTKLWVSTQLVMQCYFVLHVSDSFAYWNAFIPLSGVATTLS